MQIKLAGCTQNTCSLCMSFSLPSKAATSQGMPRSDRNQQKEEGDHKRELNSATVSTMTMDKLPNFFGQSYYYYKKRVKNQVTLRSYVISYCYLTN